MTWCLRWEYSPVPSISSNARSKGSRASVRWGGVEAVEIGREGGREHTGSGGEFVAMQPDCGVWEHNRPLRNELMHAGTRTNTHTQAHTCTHAHAGTVGICADRARKTLPWLRFPLRPFHVKTGSRRRPARISILLLIHVPPTAPVRCGPSRRFTISKQIRSPSHQSDFPPRVLFLPGVGGGLTVWIRCPAEEHCTIAENVYGIVLPSCVPPGQSRQNG